MYGTEARLRSPQPHRHDNLEVPKVALERGDLAVSYSLFYLVSGLK